MVQEYYLDEILRVHYDPSGKVDELSFLPSNKVELFINHKNLFSYEKGYNPLSTLLTMDDAPVDDFGFIVFKKLGIAITGYHDKDKSQRAITLFKKNGWLELDQASTIDLTKFKTIA